MIGKFFKHAGFVLLAGLVSTLISYFGGDASFGAFISAHPYLAFVVPLVSGLLGSLAKWLTELAEATE